MKAKGRPTKYKNDMPQKAYDILANGGTHAAICEKLDISEETFYCWLGRGKYKDSEGVKKEFSEFIERGEIVGRAWLDKKIIKAAEDYPNMLIQLAKRKDFLSRILPILRKNSITAKLDELNELCERTDVNIDTYSYGLNCLEKQAGIVEKAKYEELEARLKKLEVERGNSNAV
ncbi:hypothetical protein GAMM_130012 [Gammaproteobacteria bacterium]